MLNPIESFSDKPNKTPSFLLVGPYDPKGGEFTFIAPPLGVWRLAGVLEAAGFRVSVFDPNCCEGVTEEAFDTALQGAEWDVVGFSITGMTLPYDLALAYRARKLLPQAVLVTGGVEATFNPKEVFQLGPFDLVVLGEGEGPLLELGKRLGNGEGLKEIPGTARVTEDGSLRILHHRAMTREEMKEATFLVPYQIIKGGLTFPVLARLSLDLEDEYIHVAQSETNLLKSTVNYVPLSWLGTVVKYQRTTGGSFRMNFFSGELDLYIKEMKIYAGYGSGSYVLNQNFIPNSLVFNTQEEFYGIKFPIGSNELDLIWDLISQPGSQRRSATLGLKAPF
ncbi:MAG: cobalamin-dependent protein [Pseudomonadota bacterium]|jgi:hypothetical protein